jgi:hypothetical protein
MPELSGKLQNIDKKQHLAREKADEHLRQLFDWVQEQKDTPGFTLPTLELPPNVREAFIPAKIYELADNPDQVEIVIWKHFVAQDIQTLQMVIIEKNSPKHLTNPEAWQNWRDEMKQAAQKPGMKVFPPIPEEVDRFHAEYDREIENGVVSLQDRVMMTVNFQMEKKAPYTLQVNYFDGETRSGIGSDFYLNQLPDIARTLGFRFITGSNSEENITFFTDKLGRSRATEIEEDKAKLIFPSLARLEEDRELDTVQFLYEEDEEIFAKQKDKRSQQRLA